MERLNEVQNAKRLPVMISAGCSTARFATLPPYEAYVDIHGVEHKGSDAGEVFAEPPPPPAPYQSGRFSPPGLGKQLVVGSENGAVAYFGCNTGSQPCGLTLTAGFAQAWSQGHDSRLGDCWAEAVDVLLRQGTARDAQAHPRLVSGQHLLSRHEVHALRRSRAPTAAMS